MTCQIIVGQDDGNIQFNPNLLPGDAPDPGLTAKHLGVPVISHPNTIAAEKQAERQEDEQGKLAYQLLSDLFDSIEV